MFHGYRVPVGVDGEVLRRTVEAAGPQRDCASRHRTVHLNIIKMANLTLLYLTTVKILPNISSVACGKSKVFKRGRETFSIRPFMPV